jgi:hypothetical protein
MQPKTLLVAGGIILALAGVFVVAVGMHSENGPPEGGRDLLTTDGSGGISSFQIATADGEVLWRVEASPARPLKRLHYAEIPAGFRQVIPLTGRPRPFRKGERLKTEVMTPGAKFTHSGEAVDETRFIGGVWESGPWPPRTPGA